MNTYALDIECYKDYFLVMTKDVDSGELSYSEVYPGCHGLGVVILGRIITFNGIGYDMPMMRLAMAGCDNAVLKRANDDIVLSNMKPWDIENKYGGVSIDHVDHIDIMNVAPGVASLKGYGGRLGSRKLQDLPIDPASSISVEQRAILRKYCENDLDTTIELYRKLKPQIELREKMSKEYDIDLRSKSDAQIAEAVIKKQLGGVIQRPNIPPGFKFNYRPPEWVTFSSPGLRQILSAITNAPISLSDEGSVVMPKQFESMVIAIKKMRYKMGIGGLHSCEKSIYHEGDLRDVDVTSYYPSIILNQSLYPAHLGPGFLDVYRRIVDRRIAAKNIGDTVTADSLKIVINGSFGKFGNKWSILYSPSLLIQTTVTGQLAILMLVEMLEDSGVEVVSANTDGVVFKYKPVADTVVMMWEYTTGFRTEETKYKALYSRDVNNYIAVKENGGVKAKGIFATGGLSKNPTNTICVEAVIDKILYGTDIAQSVYLCQDITKFITCRKVKGGAIHDCAYLGKNIRWYYASGKSGYIEYLLNGNKVPRTEGVMSIMDLPDQFPTDIDYQWYIDEANDILRGFGL